MAGKEHYLCRSKRELDIKDLRYLAQNIGCVVTFAGKVKGEEKWTYFLHTQSHLFEKDFEFIKAKGLVVLLSSQQGKSLANSFDLSKVADNVVV